MSKIALDLHGKNVATKVNDGSTISANLITDSDLEVKAKGTELASKSAALNDASTDCIQKHIAAKTATDVLLVKETEYDDAMKGAADKLMEKYPKNPQKWKDEGFTIGGSGAGVTIPPQVSGLSATHSEIGTENDLHWNSIKRTKMYKVQQCANADPAVEANWAPSTPDFSFNSKLTVTGINPVVQTWYRVSAVNTAGQGIWSNPAKISV